MIITCWECNLFEIYFGSNTLNKSIECIFSLNLVIDPIRTCNRSFGVVWIALHLYIFNDFLLVTFIKYSHVHFSLDLHTNKEVKILL
jgi:hypothetical protein